MPAHPAYLGHTPPSHPPFFDHRLEAATSRLEDVAAAQLSGASQGASSTTAGLAPGSGAAGTTGTRTRSGTTTSIDSAVAGGLVASPSTSTAASDPPAVTAWDDYLDHSLKEYTSLSEQIGGLVAQQATHVVATFKAQRDLIKLAANSAKPAEGASSPVFAKLLKPLQEELIKVGELREKNRAEKVLFNHLSAVSEGIPAVGWVAVVSTGKSGKCQGGRGYELTRSFQRRRCPHLPAA